MIFVLWIQFFFVLFKNSNNNKVAEVEEFTQDLNYVSKNKRKKEKKNQKKNKSKSKNPTNQETNTKKSANVEKDELVNASSNKPSLNSSNNFNSTFSDDDLEEYNGGDINDVNNNNDNILQTDECNNSSKVDEMGEKKEDKTVIESHTFHNIALSLNDVLMQKDPLNNNFKLEAMQSLDNRSTIKAITEEDSCSLQYFLFKFTSAELLIGNNKYGCENCTRSAYRKLNLNNANYLPKEIKTVYTQATKQYLICELPAVLTIHLKRFQQNGFRLEKVNKHVNFPLG